MSASDAILRARMPAEWARHSAVWIGFPWNPEEWPGSLEAAQADIAAFTRAVHDEGRGEEVRLVVNDEETGALARRMAGDGIAIVQHRIGDVWLRDTGPIIVSDGTGLAARDFAFNGWGGKYNMPGDREIGGLLAADEGLTVRSIALVLEGGAIDVDGDGLCVTTEQCLLNPNRNTGASRDDYAAALSDHLGIDRILWLGDGLAHDHTDGHVDNLARFVGPGRLALPDAADGDPNAAVYRDARKRAEAFGVEVIGVPSPGRVLRDGQPVAASYMNFYVGNSVVVVPTYGVENDDPAIAAIGALFPGRRALGVPALGVIAGGGSFHCASQQMPEMPA